MKKFINWLDEHDLLEYVEEAVCLVTGILAVILFAAWVAFLAIVAIVIGVCVFAVSAWWLLAVIPWLALVTITIAVFCFVRDRIL